MRTRPAGERQALSNPAGLSPAPAPAAAEWPIRLLRRVGVRRREGRALAEALLRVTLLRVILALAVVIVVLLVRGDAVARIAGARVVACKAFGARLLGGA